MCFTNLSYIPIILEEGGGVTWLVVVLLPANSVREAALPWTLLPSLGRAGVINKSCTW
jgi:hypothetical protein